MSTVGSAPCDEDLFDRYRYEGDRAAFGVLQNRHHDGLFQFSWHRLSNREEAEDVAQDTWVKALVGARQYDRARRPFRAWLWGIHVKEVTNRWRHPQAVRRRAGPTVGIEEERVDPRPPGPPPEPRDAVTEAVLDCVARLRFEVRAYWLLHIVWEFTYREIEGITGVGSGTVRRVIKQGRDSLDECMEQKGHG